MPPSSSSPGGLAIMIVRPVRPQKLSVMARTWRVRTTRINPASSSTLRWWATVPWLLPTAAASSLVVAARSTTMWRMALRTGWPSALSWVGVSARTSGSRS